MASTIIHLCIAKEVNKFFNRNEKDLFLGTIAPDISREIGQNKEASHFYDLTKKDLIPDIDLFLKKYKDYLNSDFELGYFIHLLVDRYWINEYVYPYIQNYTHNNTKKDITYNAIKNLIYNDYTNLNMILIEKYNLNLDVFYNDIELPDTVIKEIPIEYLNILINKMGYIIRNSTYEKKFLFEAKEIEKFIDKTSRIIVQYLHSIFIY